ncbi:MAG TPA: uroporphyrinogen-III synthase [Nitrospirota bacterium]|nr:uroporphyrinogen-III synthase [Nitrospirota bacterium]
MRRPDGMPLSGIRVVVTRAKGQSGGFAGMLKDAGAEVVEFPTIETVPPESWDALDAAIEKVSGFDFVIFTSVNAICFLLGRMAELGRDASALKIPKLVAVGPKTAAALESKGLKADIVPAEFKAEGVVEALTPYGVRGRKALYPRAEAARDVLPASLREMGAQVEAPVAYRTVSPEVDKGFLDKIFDGRETVLTFTSSSTVKNFIEVAGERAKRCLDKMTVACIGPVTARTCEEAGLPVSVVPAEYTVDALFLALTEHFNKEKK